jgi:hypothetical protein
MKWEYLIAKAYHDLDSPQAMADLDELGNEGWELVAVYADRMFFKRPVTT